MSHKFVFDFYELLEKFLPRQVLDSDCDDSIKFFKQFAST